MTERNYGLLDSVGDIKTYVRRVLSDGKPFGFDIEAGYTGPNASGLSLLPFHPRWKIAGFSFTNDPSWARYIPLGHDSGQNAPELATARLLWVLLQSGLGVAHNAPYELQGLSRFFRDVLWDDPILGAQVQLSKGYFPVRSDSMVEAFMLQEFEPRAVGIGLKGLTKFRYGHEQVELKTFFQGRAAIGTLRFNVLELTPDVVSYACEDAVYCLMHHYDSYPQVEDMLMFKTEILLQPILARMEYEGLALDWDEYERRKDEISRFKEKMNEQIQTELETRLDRPVSVLLSSPAQVAKILYSEPPEGLGLPVKEYTDKNAPSTSESALRGLAKKDPVIKQILQWREVGKLLSSYIVKYLEQLRYADDDRAHPNHKQTGAATGRFSVDHVSYQQWPKPYKYELDDGTTLKINYRDFLIAPEGFRIVGYDFSQVELRILAGMANETSLLEAFAAGIDIHTATASLMMGIPVDQVTKKDRAVGKTLNFAIVYGSGAENIADLLGITKEQAKEYLARYFEAFPKLKGWMDERVQEGQANGVVYTRFGRKFKIWEYEDANKLRARGEGKKGDWIASKGDRMCVNAPVQGGAADYMKLGMVRVSKAIEKAGLQDKIRLVMTVHDALEFYVHESVSTQEVIDLINPAVSFAVPGLPEIRADWHEGKKWGSVVELDLDKNKQISGYGYEDEEGNKHHFDTLQAAYDHMENPPAQSPEEEPEDVPMALAPDPVVEAALDEIGPYAEEKYPEEPTWAAKPQAVVLTLAQMPLKHPWNTFKKYLAEHPGSDQVIVETPEGSLTLKTTHGLVPKDVEYLSHLMGGVTMSRRMLQN